MVQISKQRIIFTAFLPLFLIPHLMFAQATADNSTVGATTNYTLSITLGSDLAPTGTVTITFPGGYVLPTTMIASAGTNITGGFGPATPSGQAVTFTRDGTGNNVLLGNTFTVAIGTVRNPTTPNTYTLTVTTSGGAPLESFQPTIVVGAISKILIEDAAGGGGSEITTLSTDTDDDAQQFFAVARDLHDNFVSDVSPVTWAVIGGIGTVSGTASSTTLTLTSTGTGVVTVDDGSGHTDQTGTITVADGALASIVVVEGTSGDGAAFGTRSMTTDETLSLHAAGYDADSNYRSDESVTWSVTGGIGSVSPASGSSTIFDAKTVTIGAVVATHSSVGNDATGTITVNVGALDYVRINDGASGSTAEVTTDALTTSETKSVHASGYDADDNYITDQSVTWSVIGGIGTVTPTSNSSTTLTATVPGTGVIHADHATVNDDDTGTITVTVGSVASITIRDAPDNGGNAVGASTITADDQVTYYAAAYDDQSNFISDVSVTWSAASGSLAPAISGSGTSFEFLPTTSAVSGVIRATHSASSSTDDTGTITVNDGSLSYVRINSGASGNTSEITTSGLTADQTLLVHASGFDSDGNYIGDVSVNWSVSGGIGTVAPTSNSSTTLTAITVGSGVINADHATATDDATGTITITAGALASIVVVEGGSGNGPDMGARSVTTDQALTLHAAGYDSDGNYRSDESVTWTVNNGIGTLSTGSGTSTVFDPTTVASGSVQADHAVGTDLTGTIAVTAGALSYVRINDQASGATTEVTTNTLTTGGTFVVHTSGYDADGNYRSDESVTWSVTGGIGSVAPGSGVSTTLTGSTPGTGVIVADHATAIDDATGTITVNSGSIDSIVIRDQANNGGSEVTTVGLTADQTQAFYAASYDGQTNYLGDVSVTWSAASGDLAPAVSGTGASLNFEPTTAPTSGVIRATHVASGATDVSGTISVSVGPLNRIKVLSDASGETVEVPATGLQPGNQLVMHAGGFDSDGNYITDESAINWQLSAAIGTLSSSTGSSTTLTATTPGSGVITADHATVIDGSSGLITVSIGSVDSVVVRTAANNGGSPVGAVSLTTDDSTTVYAAGYDSGDNFVADVSVTWRTIGGLDASGNPTGTSFTFSPDTANTTGKIIADHATAKDDSTGTITVSPGKPVGRFTLTPVPDTLAADGVSTSLITSSSIFDADGNLIASGSLFTISLSPASLGAITDVDADPGTPTTKEIASDASSQLSFTFQAGTESGTVSVIAASVSGSATGDTTLAIGSLGINSISTTPTNVSRGQTGVAVTMSVSNQSSTEITGLTANLNFTGTVNRNADYTSTRSDLITTILAGQTVSLQFLVDVNASAALETITINGDVSGLLGSNPVSAAASAVPDIWTVQDSAQLKIDSVVTTPDTVQHGQSGIAIAVTVSNPAPAGGAAAAVNNPQPKFTLIKNASDQTSNFTVIADGGNPTSIAAQASGVFNYTVTVLASADTGQYFLDASITGQDANAANIVLSDAGADLTDTWYLEATSSLQIQSLSPYPTTVTAVRAGQTDDWRVRMAVFNGSPDAVDIDFSNLNTFVQFRIGASDVTNKFTIAPPDSLLLSGGNRLASGTTDSLDFLVDITGDTTGTATITGKITGVVVGSGGNTISDDTSDDIGLGTIQLTSSNATVSVLNTNPHVATPNASSQQAEVNTGQSFQITLEVKNDLQEAVENVVVQLLTDGTSTVVKPQDTIATIASNSIGTINFNILASGLENAVIGEIFTSRVLSAVGVQSQQQALIGTANDSTVLVRIQQPADLSLSFEPGFSQFQTADEVFQIEATVSNSGQASIGNTGELTLSVPVGYTIQTPNPAPFAASNPVSWDVKAPASTMPVDSIFARITQIPQDINSALAATVSDSADTVLVETLDVGLSVNSLLVTTPAGAQNNIVSTLQSFQLAIDVSRSPNIDSVKVTLILPGTGFALRIGESPTKYLAGQAETVKDWVIQVQDIELQDTLKVQVIGLVPGPTQPDTTVALVVTAVERANLDLESLTTDLVEINNTVSVSADQEFEIQATVKNEGTADVEGAAVLTLDLGLTQLSLLAGEQLSKAFVPNTPTTWQVKAPSIPVEQQDIKVTITSIPDDENTNQSTRVATDRLTLGVVTGDVGTVVVDTVFVERPPGAEDGTLSTEQQFTLTANVRITNVKNTNISLQIPPSYIPIDDLPKFIGDVDGVRPAQLSWKVQSPNLPSASDFLKVTATGTDLNNSERNAIVMPDSAHLTVVEKAVLSFAVSNSDADNFLTVGQRFTLTASLSKSGEAAVVGEDSVRLELPGGAGYTTSSAISQPIAPGFSPSWEIDAPTEPVTNRSITVRVFDRGTLDENNLDQFVEITPDPAAISTTVLTQAIGLNVAVLSSKRPTTVVRGATDLHLFGLKFKNTTTEIINLERINLTIQDPDGSDIAPSSIISSVRVTDYDNLSVEHLRTSSVSSNPVQLNFGPLSIASSDSEAIQFLVDVNAETELTGFKAIFASPQGDILARPVGSPDFVIIRDDSLQRTLNAAFDAGKFVLVNPELNASFFNYPNPFGSSNADKTYFNYNLSQASDVSIRIYTLLGRLVKSYSFAGSDEQAQAGNHDKDVDWDGRNDRGDKVLNGVYVAVIQTSQGTAVTKIAVAK